MTLDYASYTAGAQSAVNTSFSVADSTLVSEIKGECILYWLVVAANSGDILTSLESEKYELGWYNIDEAVIPPADLSRIPDTGVTKCYNDREEIPCPSEGEDFYGQDTNYSINPINYTKLDEKGSDLPITATTWAMIRDNVTGLIWENKNNGDNTKDYINPHDADNEYTWYDSSRTTDYGDAGTASNGTDTEDFIKALNDSNFGGHSDWRLPTLNELFTIVDYSIPCCSGPTININYFKDTIASFYWSSTNNEYNDYNKYHAWGVDFHSGSNESSPKNGKDSYNGKRYHHYVRAVRGRQSIVGAFDNLIINDNGTVTDSATGLMWQRDTSDNSMRWKEALSYCKNLNLGGYTDWRLPTIKELRSIVDYSRQDPSIDTNIFINALTYFYWSSTTNSLITYDAWGVDFRVGYANYDYKTDDNYVRAVRGGQ